MKTVSTKDLVNEMLAALKEEESAKEEIQETVNPILPDFTNTNEDGKKFYCLNALSQKVDMQRAAGAQQLVNVLVTDLCNIVLRDFGYTWPGMFSKIVGNIPYAYNGQAVSYNADELIRVINEMMKYYASQSVLKDKDGKLLRNGQKNY